MTTRDPERHRCRRLPRRSLHRGGQNRHGSGGGYRAGARYNAAAIAKQHRDHGLFISFAPAAKPRIALAVLVENGGFGATAAAPIARAALDYWLLGKNSLGLPPPQYLRDQSPKPAAEAKP